MAVNPFGNEILSHMGVAAPTSNRTRIYTGFQIDHASGLRLSGGTSLLDQSTAIDFKNVNGVAEVVAGNTVRSGQFHVGNWRGWMPYTNNYNYLGRPDLRHKTYVSGFSGEISTKTTTYQALETDHTLLADATAGEFTITLPAVVSNLAGPSGNINRSLGRILVIKKIDVSANAVTIDGNASETIDGATTLDLTTQWQSVTLQCNGTAWFVISST
jgi:hypothetical protein